MLKRLLFFMQISLALLALPSLALGHDEEIDSAPKETRAKLEQSKEAKIASIHAAIKKVDASYTKQDDIWLDKYDSYTKYNAIESEIEDLKEELDEVKDVRHNRLKVNAIKHQIETLMLQQRLLGKHKDSPFIDLITPPKLPKAPKITNPIAIIAGLNYKKEINSIAASYNKNTDALNHTLNLTDKKYSLLLSLKGLDDSKGRVQATEKISIMRIELESAQFLLHTSIKLFNKEVAEANTEVNGLIATQVTKLVYIGIAIFISILIAFTLKLAIRKYVHGNDKIYTSSKAINFLNILTILLILMFSYMENVTYLVAFIGFASAGLAVAMKDLFMSIIGWFVIVLGGSIHVGDRIRVTKQGDTYIGDVLDISVLRITISEDITLQTVDVSRRAGRVIFIPNNYVFTTMLVNYTHGGVYTVWDGIDFFITFDSNYKKAMSIANEVATTYSKGYTAIAKTTLLKLRDRYSFKSINTEPRIYSFLSRTGVQISLWYETNAYSLLTMRSAISSEILDRFLLEEDIFIAYNTTKLVKTRGDGFLTKLKWDE